MATQYSTKSNHHRESVVKTPVLIVDTASTKGYTVDLPPGVYVISMTVNSSLTGTSSTIGTIRPYANAAQTRVTNQDLSVVRPSDNALTTKSVTLPAAGSGKIVHVVGDANLAPVRELAIPFGFRFVITKGSAVTGELLEVVVMACKSV